MLRFLRSLFSRSSAPAHVPGNTAQTRISADILNEIHPRFETLRRVNGSPSAKQLRELLNANGGHDFSYHDGSGDFYRFRLVSSDATYRIDILESPSYGTRATDSHSTHRLNLDTGTPCICIKSGHEPRDKGIAAGIAIDWAKRTSRYIRNGQPWNS